MRSWQLKDRKKKKWAVSDCEMISLRGQYYRRGAYEKVYCRNCSRHSLDDKLFYFLTFAGGSIVKKYLFNFNFRPDFKSNFLYPVAILNNLQEKCVIQWVVSDNVYYMNPLKKRSTWMNSNDIVEIRTKNYVKSIFLLSSKNMKEDDDMYKKIVNK